MILLTQFCTFRNQLKLKPGVIMSHSSSSYTRKEDAIMEQNTRRMRQASLSSTKTNLPKSECHLTRKLQTPNISLTTNSSVCILRVFIRVIHFSFKKLSSFHPPPSFNSKIKNLLYASDSVLPFHQH